MITAIKLYNNFYGWGYYVFLQWQRTAFIKVYIIFRIVISNTNFYQNEINTKQTNSPKIIFKN